MKSVDTAEAARLLNEEWSRVSVGDQQNHFSHPDIAEKITKILNASQLTYKYILVTNILAKAVNPDIHYRAMQAQSELSGAYNARSLGHKVLVEWEKAHGERLGGSNEPFLNKPARYPAFSMDNAHRSEQAHRRLYDLLSELEERTECGEVDPLAVLRYTLAEISKLKSRVIDFESPSEVPFRELRLQITGYLEKSGGGERLAAVTAGIMDAYYHSTDGTDWSIAAEHANVPDEFSNAAGDVEVFREGKLMQAFEIKDKPTERSDIQHIIRKAQKNELGEYLYVVGSGFRNGQERQAAMEEITDAPVEILIFYPDELIATLKLVGDSGREVFCESVGTYLNDMRASDANKEAWNSRLERL